ncbi:MAG TPA: GNAT family N-acetyltransferase [Acidimicrobiales bacterium]|nr:GNAT family N-acetyltransferase [Acidimicrobiales bacterium]
MAPPELRTERLVLRQWREDDRDAWAAMNADPRVMEHFPSTLTRAEADQWLEFNRDRLEARGWGLWAVEVPGVAPFIGFVGLNGPGFDVPGHGEDCLEVGWRLAAEHWGKGYAPEGAQAALDLAWDELGLDEVVSFTAVGNTKSRRVMEKLGLVLEREFDHPRVPDGSPIRRHALYRIGRPER